MYVTNELCGFKLALWFSLGYRLSLVLTTSRIVYPGDMWANFVDFPLLCDVNFPFLLTRLLLVFFAFSCCLEFFLVYLRFELCVCVLLFVVDLIGVSIVCFRNACSTSWTFDSCDSWSNKHHVSICDLYDIQDESEMGRSLQSNGERDAGI